VSLVLRAPPAAWLEREDISYVWLGAQLGGRPSEPECYRDGVVDYEAVARTASFHSGLDALIEAAARHGRVCLMCTELAPLDCPRCLLVARALVERNLDVKHILLDGSIEPHAAVEERLLQLAAGEPDLFHDRPARLAAAYRRRARVVAARIPSRSPSSRAKT
jgi:uncharacterized protein (DUF488 family)